MAMRPGSRLHGGRLGLRLVATALALVTAAPPAGSARPGAGATLGDGRAALAEARRTASRLQASADEIRADLSSGSFLRALGRLAEMAGLEAATPSAPTLPAGDAAALAALPPELATPIGDLLAAARYSSQTVGRAVAADDGRSEALSARAGRLAHRALLDLAAGRRIHPRDLLAVRREVVANPILLASARGSLAIAAALDRSLPALMAAADRAPAPAEAPPCDTVDARPYLCVTGLTGSTIDTEAVLLVDLGGTDTYLGSAGGANVARCGSQPDPQKDPSCTTSVLVDLGGDDRYVPDLTKTTPFDHLVFAGSGMQGVGFLVDAGGSDVYEAHVPADRERPLDLSFLFGSAQLGTGMLADLAGNDRYELTGTPAIFAQPYTHGSSLTGMGAILDFGGTNAYRTEVKGVQQPNLENPLGANDFIEAQGVGLFGSGALFDASGQATLEAIIDLTAGAQDAENIGNVVAQGTAVAGGAALITGPGSTTYTAVTRRVATHQATGSPGPVVMPGGAFSTAQGIAAIAYSVLDDAGGDDRYTVLAQSIHDLRVTAAGGCGCNRAEALLDTTGLSEGFPADEAGAGVSAQGVGSALFVPDAGGFLSDHLGNDTYVARSEFRVSAAADNLLPDPAGGALAEAVPSRFPFVNASGQGLGSDGAPGVLVDAAGADRYEFVVDTATDAVASGGPAAARAVGPWTQTYGQGASLFDPAQGVFMDLGGADRYTAAALSRASATPAPGAYDADRAIGVQGAVGGVFADLDAAVNDAFSAAPEVGPGVGVRGEGPGWVDVSQLFPGYGIAPLQPAKTDLTLTMDPANPATVTGGWVPFRARLTGPGGPIVGAEVTFVIEVASAILGVVPTWVAHELAAHGFTDQDGWATAWLDADQFRSAWGGDAYDPDERVLRVAARYAGNETARPALGTQTFRIENA